MKPRGQILIITVQVCCSLVIQAQEVRYTYDAAGNRTGYEVEQQIEDTTVIQKITEAPQQEQLQEVFTVRVYPNPVSSILHVDLPDLPQGKTGTLELYSSMGNSAMSPKPLSQVQSIDLSGVLPGLYMVRVTAGRHTVVTKILKL
jgi:hypothetical protein